MGTGERHYSFSLRFSDELRKKEKEYQLKKDGKTKKLDIFDEFERSIMQHTEMLNQETSNEILSSEKLNIKPNSGDIIHPLGELGTSLTEQLKYAKNKQSSSNTDTSNSDTDDLSDVTSVTAAIAKKRAKRKLERRGSQFEINKISKYHRSSLDKFRNDDLMDDSQPPSLNQSVESLLLDTDHSSSKSFDTQDSATSACEITRNSNKILYATKALIIFSRYPLIGFFKEYLTQIYEYAITKSKGKCKMIPIERYISNLLYDVVLPPPGNDIQLVVHGPISTLYLHNPPTNDLPLIDVSLLPLLISLDRKNLIQVFIALTLERKVLFTCGNVNLLHHCIHALLSLLYPYEWQVPCVPLVPISKLDFAQSPTPIILGIPSSYIGDDLILDDEVSFFLFIYKK